MERVRARGKGVRGDHGGWVPVIQNHRAHVSGRLKDKETFTLYVDNIPKARDIQWLSRTFNKFGLVKDAFISRKKSLRTGSNLGL